MKKQGKHSKNGFNFLHAPCVCTLLDYITRDALLVYITHDSDYWEENTMLTMIYSLVSYKEKAE